MAYELIKVPELPELTTPSDPNVIPIQDGDYLKRISFENLKEAATGGVADDLAAEVTARESAVSGEATARGNADTAILADLASPYSASATYAVGDYCTKDGQLYRCTTAVETAEAWTAAHWTAVALGNDVSDLKNALNSIATFEVPKTNFISGVYQWDKVHSEMLWSANVKRATADLRNLGLEQGDSIGITDYATYSIAFGDNGSWYGGGYATSDITANNVNILPYIILVKRNDDADMTSDDFATLKAQFHSSKDVRQITATEEFAQSVGAQLDVAKRANNNYLHFSFDDVGYCVLNLVNNGASFNSLWDEPFFGMLKRLHDTYGAIFSLYIWDVANLANIPSKFKTEFMTSSEWLKFGFHSYAEGSLADTSYNDAKTQYETFINYVFSKIGGVNSVDRMPRLNYFAGNVNALRALRDANCGCIGFLNTDDTRSAYYLTQEELTYLRTHSLWSDRTNGLQFVSTVMRLDWFVSGFSSQYDYNVPVEDNPYDELVYRYGQPAMADLYSELIVFTHEWQTYSSSYALNSAMVSRIEQVCQFANDYGYDFDYPQNRIPNITSAYISEQVINNFVTTVKGKWSFGAVEDSGNIVSSTTRIKAEPFKASKVVVDFPSGYKVNVCRYNSEEADSSSYVDRTNWKATKQTVTGDYYYVIVASTTSDTATLDIANDYTITAVRNINDI